MAPALQISIPTASTASPSGSKPFTQYHVVLQLPLRKHEIRKRYTDFEKLHADLQAQTGAPPPAPLPAKSWLRRTVNNDALTEERRLALQTYVKAILEAQDGKWRSSSAWRSFLNLPSGTSTVTANGQLSPTSQRRGSVGITDPNTWLEAHRDLKAQINTARQQLKARDTAATPQQQHATSADAKASLVRAATSVEALESGLRSLSSPEKASSKRLGDGELRRRRDLLLTAKSEIQALETVLLSAATSHPTLPSTTAPASAASKSSLFTHAPSAKPGRVLGGPLKETERTRELDNSGVLQLQTQILAEQDEDVLSLGKTVGRLKDMGILINEELEVQNEMLGLIEGDVERVQGKIDVGRKRIARIS